MSRSLGPRWIVVLAVTVLAAGAGAALALSGGRSHARHAGPGPRASLPTTTSPTAQPGARHRGGSTHRVSPGAKHVNPAKVAKSSAKHTIAPSAHSSHHAAAPVPTHPSTTTTSPSTKTTSTPSPGPTSVSLHIYGGGNASVVACGDLHHFRTYPAGSPLKFTGAVQPVPSARWKVELHIKVCRGGAYQDFVKVGPHINKHTGAFDGTFSAPPSGLYDVTPVLYLNSVESVYGDDVHIETR